MRRLSSSSSGQGFRLLVRLAFFAAAASLSAQQAPESATTTIRREVKDVFERCAKAVVKIEETDQDGELSATAFFVDPTAPVHTASSVGDEAETMTVEFKGNKYPARQLLPEPPSGIAMLKGHFPSPSLP